MKLSIVDTKKAKQFATMFQLLSNISTTEINIHFNEDELYFQGMDSARICIFELRLASDWFDTYEVDNSTVIGVNLRLMGKVLSCREPSQHLSVVYSLKKPDEVEFQFENGEKSVTNKYFTIPLYDLSYDMLDLSNQDDYQADIKMHAAQLHALIEQIVSFGEYVTFECNEEHVQFSSGDVSNGTIKAPIKIDDLLEYSIEDGVSIVTSYASKYIKHITAFSKMFKYVSLHTDKNGSNKPFKYLYCFDENTKDEQEDKTEDEDVSTTNTLTIYLAPRITDEEEDETDSW